PIIAWAKGVPGSALRAVRAQAPAPLPTRHHAHVLSARVGVRRPWARFVRSANDVAHATNLYRSLFVLDTPAIPCLGSSTLARCPARSHEATGQRTGREAGPEMSPAHRRPDAEHRSGRWSAGRRLPAFPSASQTDGISGGAS